MISNLAIFFMMVTLVLSVVFPVGLVIYFYRKHGISVKAVMVGALMFFLFQGVLRIPAMTYIQTKPWYTVFTAQNMVLTVFIMAFTAALFETAGRYIGLKLLLKGKLSRKNGIAYGIGHGGIEAILLVGITYIVNLIYSILINNGTGSSTIASSLMSVSPDMFLAAGIERIFTIIFHIAMALLVTYGIMSRKKIFILYCIIIHTAVDFLPVMMSINKIPIWGIEAVIGCTAILSFAFIMKSRRMFEKIE